MSRSDAVELILRDTLTVGHGSTDGVAVTFIEGISEAAEAIRAMLSASPSSTLQKMQIAPQTEPVGWMLVPVEPTEEMLESAWAYTVAVTPEERMASELGDSKTAFKLKMKRRFAAMLSALPTSEGKKTQITSSPEPAGWKLVPERPTIAMKAAAGKLWGYDCAHDVWSLMLSASPPEPVSGWRDIATAPRDGTPILAGSINHKCREVVCWQDGLPRGQIEVEGAVEEGWVNDGQLKDRFHANPNYFTHWVPLLSPPSEPGVK